jgi:Zn-dependent M16 (insulinase) family peptidase
MRPRHLLTMLLPLPLALTTCCPPDPVKPTPPKPDTGSGSVAKPVPTGELDLAEGTKLHGFTTAAIYLDDADKPVGGRFVHDATKFTLDYLRVETAPQGFIWVTSFPTSDKGEPHTQEHLLLGKGDRGRKFGSFQAMALAESSAFTAQWRTAYHFHTVAGHDVFWPVFADQLDAMVNPDYTDEEIRREVRNFGVDKGDDGKLRLEEKGTVYNEMVRTYENPDVGMWRAMGQLVYGPTHPLALDSGGQPDAIRTMTPQDIRTFHKDNYHLANMGMIAAFPASMTLASVLADTDKVLAAARAKNGYVGKTLTEADLPKPAGAASGTLKVVDYPYADATNPGPMTFAWPATRKLDDGERLLLGLFLDTFAGDESTVLYKKLIDSKTRVLDLGASGVWSYNTDDQGQPVFIGVSGVKPDKLDDKSLAEVRTLILGELDRIAKLPDGDAELAAIHAKLSSRVVDLQRRMNKFLDSPPGFGFRGASSSWMDHLQSLSKTGGFKKSLTMRPALAKVREVLATKGNPWRDRIKAWGLADVPYGVASRPSPDYRKKLDAERKARIDTELARLQAEYKTKDVPSTLARFEKDYDAATKKLEAASAELPPLVASLPMTLDDGLAYTTGELGVVKTFVATFDSMASSRVSLAFRLNNRVAPADGMYLAALPSLLSDAGVIVDGKPIAADEVREQIRKEILELSMYFTDDDRTGRVELVVAGAGNGAAETKAALTWMHRVLFSPDWRAANLPRLRDLIDQRITGLRQRMLGAEEGWVNDPRDAWRHQSALQAHTGSFLTQMHDLHRLRWQLLGTDPKVTEEVGKFLALVGDAAKQPRARLVELAKGLAKLDDAKLEPKAASKATIDALGAAQKLSPEGKKLAVAAGKDLSALLADLPDSSLAADWKYLAAQMAGDLAIGAPTALAKLEALRAQIIQAPAARLVEVGSRASQTAIAGELDKLVRALPTPQQGNAFGEARLDGGPFKARLKQRDPSATNPVFVGLVAPGTSSGVFLNLAPATSYADVTDDAVLDYLASNLYTGHGGHSVFMKTWAAGLAYSNGLRPTVEGAALIYYAERTPLLPTTMKFVIDELKKAKPDAAIARYAVSNAFASRVASSYEARASAMAANLVDGQTPELVKAFRTRVLEIAKQPDIATKLFARMESTYGKVLPGYGITATKPDASTTYFVIGPDKQLTAWEDYLKTTYKDPKIAKLYRLYPRDFWIPAP